jgi:hypothetical protein
MTKWWHHLVITSSSEAVLIFVNISKSCVLPNVSPGTFCNYNMFRVSPPFSALKTVMSLAL